MTTADELFMREALVEAVRAQKTHEVPVGAILVIDGLVVARAHTETARRGCPNNENVYESRLAASPRSDEPNRNTRASAVEHGNGVAFRQCETGAHSGCVANPRA